MAARAWWPTTRRWRSRGASTSPAPGRRWTSGRATPTRWCRCATPRSWRTGLVRRCTSGRAKATSAPSRTSTRSSTDSWPTSEAAATGHVATASRMDFPRLGMVRPGAGADDGHDEKRGLDMAMTEPAPVPASTPAEVDWYALSVDDVLAKVSVGLDAGLSADEVKR